MAKDMSQAKSVAEYNFKEVIYLLQHLLHAEILIKVKVGFSCHLALGQSKVFCQVSKFWIQVSVVTSWNFPNNKIKRNMIISQVSQITMIKNYIRQ